MAAYQKKPRAVSSLDFTSQGRNRAWREREDLPEAEAVLAPTRKRLAELRMAVASPSGYDRRDFDP